MNMKLMTTFVIDFGSILGAFWEHFGSFFAAFLGAFRCIFAALGCFFAGAVLFLRGCSSFGAPAFAQNFKLLR